MDDHNQPPSNLPAPASRSLSPRELAQRRAAAKKSTGPRTPEGKAAARLNAIRHGFFARDVVNAVLDGQSRVAEFKALRAALVADLRPVGAFEQLLVEEIAACCWRFRRALRSECREAWCSEEEQRNGLAELAPTFALLGSAGLQTQRAHEDRQATLRRAELDSMLLPPPDDLIAILRFERVVKRQLYRALNTLLHLQAKRRESRAEQTPRPDAPN